MVNVFKSRTVWTLIGLFVFNGLQGVSPMVSGDWSMLINALIAALGIFYRVNPRQDF